MGGKQSFQPGYEMLCPKCPLTPIISLSLNTEGILTCEYRCPFMHFGHVPFEEIGKDKENKHGVFCDRCQKQSQQKKEEKVKDKNIIEGELLYCGTCKQFICQNCREEHAKEKESHVVLVPKSQIKYICLEHGERYTGYCFTCLISVCKKCQRHDKHRKKEFEEFYPGKDFSDNYKYYIDDYNNYLKSFKKSKGMNRNQFENFKKRNELLLNICNYLKTNFEENRRKNTLNGEIIINYLNVVNFNYKAENYDKQEDFTKYCKTHLILANKPISDICTFSKTKSDFNISKLDVELFNNIENKEQTPKYFKYSPVGKHIAYTIGPNLIFLSTTKENDENKGFKIRLDSNISSFNIINNNILCICCEKIYFYQLSKSGPYYTEYKNLPVLGFFDDFAQEIIGDIENNLVVRTKKELLVINDKKKKFNFEIVTRTELEDFNKTVTEEKVVPDNTGYYYYGNRNRTKTIKIETTYVTILKALYDDYIVTIEKGKITTRKINDLKILKVLSSNKTDCLVYNGNVMVPEDNKIMFYTIPNLENVSKITVNDTIVSLNLINRRTFIVLEKKYIEQFEANTWKRLWRQIGFGEIIQNLSEVLIIGAYKELFLYSKELGAIYKAIAKN